MTSDYCAFVRALLYHFLRHGRIRYAEYNALAADLVAREQRTSGCSGKRGFDTWKLAQQVASRHALHRKARKVYACSACGKFHLGGASPSSRHMRHNFRLKKHGAAYA